MRVYIAGRVTGLPYEEAKAKFERAEEALRASNFNPVNPLKHVNSLASNRDAMKVCMPLLMDCNAILLLNDYEFSEGAKVELACAQYIARDEPFKIMNEDDLNQQY
jgi:hypothetical protein